MCSLINCSGEDDYERCEVDERVEELGVQILRRMSQVSCKEVQTEDYSNLYDVLFLVNAEILPSCGKVYIAFPASKLPPFSSCNTT